MITKVQFILIWLSKVCLSTLYRFCQKLNRRPFISVQYDHPRPNPPYCKTFPQKSTNDARNQVLHYLLHLNCIPLQQSGDLNYIYVLGFRSPTRIGSIGISFTSTVWLLLAPFKTTNARPFLLWIIYHGNLPWHAELHIWHICQSSQHILPQSWIQVRLAGLATRMPTIHVLSPNRLLRAKHSLQGDSKTEGCSFSPCW